MKCLLCGYDGDDSSQWHCAWCAEEAKLMSEAEVKALRKLATIEAPFQVWSPLDSMSKHRKFQDISMIFNVFHSFSYDFNTIPSCFQGFSMALEVRGYLRREDSEGCDVVRSDVPVEQPAQIFPGLKLHIGDVDDANVATLRSKGPLKSASKRS